MKLSILTSVFILFLVLFCAVVFAEDRMWVASEGAKLKENKKASSQTIVTLPIGTEVTILEVVKRWYRVVVPSGEEGWIYRGRLSQSPPEKKSQDETGNLLSGLMGSGVKADESDTARSIRGLSSETEAYAKARGTPMEHRRALDRVLSMRVREKELVAFLRQGKIGEYAQ